MEHHGGVLAYHAIVAVVVGLGVEQEVGDIHRDHQEQFTLTAVDRAVGPAQQQHQGWQHVEQRGEEDVEVSDISSGEPRHQQEQ
ncbi:hypothetical protein D3C77_465990 [compost metagenome]